MQQNLNDPQLQFFYGIDICQHFFQQQSAPSNMVMGNVLKCFGISNHKERKEDSPSSSDHIDVKTSAISEMEHITRILSEKAVNLKAFSFNDLKNATMNFSKALMVGEGGFGTVYKGYIKISQDALEKTVVAIKRLNKKGSQGHKEWVTEVQFLGLVDHPNLVKLLGYCAEDDERGFQRLLVYEFMPNKSLGDHLFNKELPVLPWNVRLTIALGAANGLTNLHEELEFQIIFRDFKSSNVLLDADFSPKLSDFGMARVGPVGGITHVSTGVVGTLGYAAPEYVQTGHLTAKSDVWSFGVVLCELLTGRKCMDKSLPKSEQKLLEWIKPHLTESRKFRSIIDPRLKGQCSIKSAQKVAILAQKCLVKHAKNRPKMSQVVYELKQIIEALEFSKSQMVTGPSIPRTSSDISNDEAQKESVDNISFSGRN